MESFLSTVLLCMRMKKLTRNIHSFLGTIVALKLSNTVVRRLEAKTLQLGSNVHNSLFY